MNEKPIIYQLFPRIMTNMNAQCEPWGTYEKNGSGKFNVYSGKLLKSIKALGVTLVW